MNPKNKKRLPSGSGTGKVPSPTSDLTGGISKRTSEHVSPPLLRRLTRSDVKNQNERLALRSGKYCNRCWLQFGIDGIDSRRYKNSGYCQRCRKEIKTHKVEINHDGGLVVTRSRYDYVPWYEMGDGGSTGGKRWD